MTELFQYQCEACSTDTPRMTTDDISEWVGQLHNWQIVEKKAVPQLLKIYEFSDFMAALAFANNVGALAESNGHHPALLVEWGRVTVRWWTHKIAGLHKNDLIMASKTDHLLTAHNM